MSEKVKPIPIIDNDSEFFWKQCYKGKLMLPYCTSCKQYHFYPRILCPHCMSDNIMWKRSEGIGRVHTFTIVRRAPITAFKQDVPYVVAIIELNEGPRMMSNLIHVSVDKVYCDMSVKVNFEYLANEVRLPKFEPILN